MGWRQPDAVQRRIEGLLEDYALARLIEEHCDEEAFEREPALAYYQSLEKGE
jgi:hypothetical protein